MRREIFNFMLPSSICGCCPGHDIYPNSTYRSRRSKHARSRDKKVEHQHARSIAKRTLFSDLKELKND